jgi:hypothetical protein
MAAAHADPQVRVVVDRFLAYPMDGMVRLLVRAMYGNWDPRSHRSIILQVGIPNQFHDLAYELMEAATAIASREVEARSYCRGAILEGISHGLLSRRSRNVLEEQRLGPFPDPPWRGGVSDPVDFVLLEVPIEIYECKSVPREVESKHLQTIMLARQADPGVHGGFITLAYRADLVVWLADFTDYGAMFAYTFEDFLTMAQEKASARVA